MPDSMPIQPATAVEANGLAALYGSNAEALREWSCRKLFTEAAECSANARLPQDPEASCG